MTPSDIMQIVSFHGDEEDMTHGEIQNLMRYFVKQNCIWHTNESLAKDFNVNASSISRSIQVVENDRKYQFIKNRIQRALKEAEFV